MSRTIQQFALGLQAALLVVCLPFLAWGQGTVTINGPDTVCIGMPVSYYVTPVAGQTYHWSVSAHGNLSGSATGTGAGVIWVASGLASVSVTASPGGASGSYPVYVVAVPKPAITTNFTVGCQSLAYDSTGREQKEPPEQMLDDAACIKVCESSYVRYYAQGSAGSSFSWTVTGGTMVHNWGDSIEVFWPAAGTAGQVTLTETRFGCQGVKTLCIEVIAKPKALFAVLPDLTPPPGYIEICKGETVIFKDLSAGSATSPIVSWYWDFGDGTTSAQQHPTHTFNDPSTGVYLVVKNACNCTDTFKIDVKFMDQPGPEIICPSVVCEGEKAKYSTPVHCGKPFWEIIGGTLLSGQYTPDIEVVWDHPGPDGFGYVSLTIDGCNYICKGTTTIKVPVILEKAVIQGPAMICVGKEYEYSLPLWPATQYNWGVIGDPSAIIGQRKDYRVVVEFTSPGTYTLHGTYQNSLKRCGGDVTLEITVVAPTEISGDTTACEGDSAVYSLSGGVPGSWVLTDPVGNTSSGYGNSFTAGFPIPGVYTLQASGAFCLSAPYHIVVQGLPPAVDSITGPDTVCLNRPYTYTAGADVADAVYSWTIQGGTATPAFGKTVTVVFTSPGGPLSVSVNRVHKELPNCPGPVLTQPVIREQPVLNLSGNPAPCVNAYQLYSSGYTRGEVYDWEIIPNTAGSVVSGHHSDQAQILWNNAAGPATIRVTMRKCDQVYMQDYAVVVQPAPVVSLSGPSIACPGEGVSFTATAGGATYTWDFGDGATAVTTSPTSPVHGFPVNLSTANMPYTVKVTVSPDPSSPCPVSGTAYTIINITPGPGAFASTSDPVSYCTGDPVSSLLLGTVTNNVGILSYEWHQAGVGIVGSSVNYTATAAGSYYFIVLASNGCRDTSNVINIVHRSCGSGPGGCSGSVTGMSSDYCGTITLTGSGSGTNSQWTAATVPPSGPLPAGATATAVYDYPGVYSFTFQQYFPALGCWAATQVKDTIPLIARFFYTSACGSGNNYLITLKDNSLYLSGVTITGITWLDGSSVIGGGSNLTTPLTAGMTHTITEVVSYSAFGNTFTCSTTHVISLPAKPSAAFTAVTTPICEGVTIHFTPVATAGLGGYSWDFGDLSGSDLSHTQRTFTWDGTIPYSTFNVTLSVSDTLGCTADYSLPVNIYDNTLDGSLGTDFVVCDNAAPVTLTYDSSSVATVNFLWNTGVTTSTGTLNVGQSGAYWVTAIDVHQCQKTTEAVKVTIIETPVPQITGQQEYCDGDEVRLYGYVGEDPNISYNWYRNGVLLSNPESYLFDPGLPVGTYIYTLEVVITDPETGIVCQNTSAPDTVRIYGLPAPPFISGPVPVDCNNYHIRLTASGPGPGSYTWSNGTHGATNDVYAGGPYRLWYTDLHGCRSHADAYVPHAPDKYFPYFPSGCYEACKDQLPLTLYGPPGVSFNYWAWLYNGGVASSGGGYMLPYSITAPGSYQWLLHNGLCQKKSEEMNLQIIDCKSCEGIFDVRIRCNPELPGSYYLDLLLFSPAPGTHFTLGTSLGPVIPSSGTMPAAGYYPVSASFTALSVPAPSVMEIEVLYTLPDGSKCYKKLRVQLPRCEWKPQRQAQDTDSSAGERIASGLLVYPNPADGLVSISYDYGLLEGSSRIVVYDALGRKQAGMEVSEKSGRWQLPTGTWTPGVYIIRMERDGQAVHTQRLIIKH